MRVSKMFMATQREVPADAEIPSHQLMLRAGMMKKVASGIYSFMPIGLRSYKKVENIIREEMDKAGAQELIMPAILPSEVYQASGRWDKFGPEMFRLLDRGGRQFCLGPTHEEPFTETVRDSIRSYKQLPVTLYQIQHKYRDEKRPRFGIMRCREFVMKDAYSFDADEAGLDISYQTMYKAYCSIFDRLGLDYIVVDADSGAMGGSGSQEFMVKNSVGEDGICYCDSCGYAANEEKATCQVLPSSREEAKDMTKVHTPNVKTIEELMAFMNSAPSSFAKTILYNIDGKIVNAIMKDIQFHPVTDKILHVDFYQIDESKPIVMEVPVKLEGQAEGVKAGGKLALQIRKLKVKALYNVIPERLVVDVTPLGLGKTIKVGELKYEGLELLNAKEAVVCAVKLTRAARGAQAAAGK